MKNFKLFMRVKVFLCIVQGKMQKLRHSALNNLQHQQQDSLLHYCSINPLNSMFPISFIHSFLVSHPL